MTFNKKQEEFKQTVFSNIAETRKDHTRHYYAIIEVDNQEKLYNYDCIGRSEALEYFQEAARIDFGKFKMMSVYK